MGLSVLGVLNKIESQLELTALGWPTCPLEMGLSSWAFGTVLTAHGRPTCTLEMGLSVLGILNRVESQLELTGRRLHRAGRAAVLCTGLGLQVPACVREVLREPPRAQVRRQLLTNFCTSFSQRFLQAHASHRSQAARDCLHHASLAGSEQVAESFGGVLFASPERQATSSFGSMSSVVDMTLLLKSP